jgi:hypothetical protein
MSVWDKVWHSGNDGANSTLDADLLDGNHASAFYLASNPAGYTTNTGTVTGVTGTAPIVSSGGTAPAISISAATQSAAGSMSSADKTKLDGIAAGAQVNVATNLAQGTRTTTQVPVTSSTGTTATLDSATTSLAGVMSSADKTKLNGIATGATANTGTVTSVSAGTQISGMAMTITNGTTTPSIATSISNAANFRTAIGAGTGNGTVTAVTGTAPIVSSGGTAPAISISAATTSAAGSMSAADKTKLDGIASGATANTGTVISVATGSGLTGGTITTSGTLSVDSTVVRTTGAQSISGVKTLGNSFTGTSGTSTIITSEVIAGALPSAPLLATGLSVTATGNSVDFHSATGIIAKAVGGLSNDAIVAYGLDGVFIAASDGSTGKSLRLKGVSGTSATTTLQTNSATSSSITVTLPSTTGTLALTGAFAATSHTHGNITSAGAIGGTSGLPIITTTGGVLTTGSFGTTSGTFTQGNDSRLSDSRIATFWEGVSTNSVGFTSKAATISGFTRTLGALIRVRFTNGNTANTPTLNISSTGAANIRINGNNATSGNFNLSPNQEVLFRWDGTFYQVLSTSLIPNYTLIGVSAAIANSTTYTTLTFPSINREFILNIHQDFTTGAIIARLPLTITGGTSYSLDTTARTHRVAWSNGFTTQVMNVELYYSGTTLYFRHNFTGANLAFRWFGY